MTAARSDSRSVVVLAYEGLNLFDFAMALEVFGEHGGRPSPGWYSRTAVSLEGSDIVADNGLHVALGENTDALSGAHTMVFPGWRMGPVPEHICATLRDAHARGVRILSICTGAFVLAAAGLLDGRRAATHWRFADRLAEAYPAVRVEPAALYIDDGDILTSAGGTAGTDLLLHVIRKDFGTAACNHVARGMVAAPHREGGQAQFIAQPVPAAGQGRFAEVIDAMRADLRRSWTIEALAERAAMSPRSFFRKFRAMTGQAPYDWLMAERIRAAKLLLEDTELSVDRIAEETGFGASDTFRHHFRRLVGTTPTQFRLTFRGPVGLAGEAA